MRELTAKEVETLENKYNSLKDEQAKGAYGIHEKLLILEEECRQCGYRFKREATVWRLVNAGTPKRALIEDEKWRPPGLVNNRRHWGGRGDTGK